MLISWQLLSVQRYSKEHHEASQYITSTCLKKKKKEMRSLKQICSSSFCASHNYKLYIFKYSRVHNSRKSNFSLKFLNHATMVWDIFFLCRNHLKSRKLLHRRSTTIYIQDINQINQIIRFSSPWGSLWPRTNGQFLLEICSSSPRRSFSRSSKYFNSFTSCRSFVVSFNTLLIFFSSHCQ